MLPQMLIGQRVPGDAPDRRRDGSDYTAGDLPPPAGAVNARQVHPPRLIRQDATQNIRYWSGCHLVPPLAVPGQALVGTCDEQSLR